MPKLATPFRPVESALPIAPVAVLPITALAALPANPPIPPNAAPTAVPTPGTNMAMGATTLAAFLRNLPTFLKKPNSSKPVMGFRLAMPAPTTYCSGSRPISLNRFSTAVSKSGSCMACTGKTTSPGVKWASVVSPPRPSAAIICTMSAIGAFAASTTFSAMLSNIACSSGSSAMACSAINPSIAAASSALGSPSAIIIICSTSPPS